MKLLIGVPTLDYMNVEFVRCLMALLISYRNFLEGNRSRFPRNPRTVFRIRIYCP